MTHPQPIWEITPGLTDYPTAVAKMQKQIAEIRAKTAPELVWLLQHPPLYTEGTSARPEDLQDPARFPTYKAGRGGQWTYHGPGQRIAYVMLDLSAPHGSVPARDVRCYVAGLERWAIETLKEFGVKGEIRDGRVGIWVVRPDGREDKIGAIGVRVSHWVTWHGISLNIAPDLSHFTGIVPCGISEHGVTSLQALGIDARMEDVDTTLQRCWHKVFG